jgi:hypothetical protein
LLHKLGLNNDVNGKVLIEHGLSRLLNSKLFISLDPDFTSLLKGLLFDESYLSKNSSGRYV